MLTERMVQATIPAADIDRAMRWYEEKLGFKPVSRIEGGAMYEAGGGTHFFLYPTTHAGLAPQTVMSFMTPDVDTEVRDLKARGVVFEEYDLPGIKTVELDRHDRLDAGGVVQGFRGQHHRRGAGADLKEPRVGRCTPRWRRATVQRQ